MPANFWKSETSFAAAVAPFDASKKMTAKSYTYMFERLREKAGVLDEIICKISDVLVRKATPV
jgi:hypothetical protein